MTFFRFALGGAIASVFLFFSSANVRAADKDKVDVEQNVKAGLDWLAKQQIKRNEEGWWEANGGQYPTTMTGLSGMCFLLEGSTMKEGKYSAEIRRAVNWYLNPARARVELDKPIEKDTSWNGLLGNPSNPTESSRYMYGQGFGLLFLSCAYGEEDDVKKRKILERVISKAVLFCGSAQTDRGGWGYVSAKDGGGFDEGSVTITQLQGLRAARNAGIHVPKQIIDKAVKYLHDCTTSRGGIIYSLAHGSPAAGGERPPLTAAAVACAVSAGVLVKPAANASPQAKQDFEYATKWLKYCKESIPFGKGRLNHDEYQNYYFSQAVYILGDDGYAKIFPGDRDPMKWSDFRNTMYDYLKSGQQKEGYWNTGGIGTIYSTAINLTILQLENATLPIYQR